MLCLSASPQLISRMIGRTMGRKSLATAVSLALSVLGWCAATPTPSVAVHPAPLSQLEKKLRRVPAHISEFSPVSEPLALPKCGNTRPPEALLTPDPVLQGQDELNVRVSFIVGSDGRVFSPFILNSGTPTPIGWSCTPFAPGAIVLRSVTAFPPIPKFAYDLPSANWRILLQCQR